MCTPCVHAGALFCEGHPARGATTLLQLLHKLTAAIVLELLQLHP